MLIKVYDSKQTFNKAWNTGHTDNKDSVYNGYMSAYIVT